MADIIRYVDTDVVGGAGDGTSWADAYSSASAWNAAEATDLPTDDDKHFVYDRASAGTPETTALNLASWETDATRDIHIIVPVEYRHDGTAGTGYRFVGDFGFTSPVTISEAYVTVVGVAASYVDSGAVGWMPAFRVVSSGAGIRIFDSCLAYNCTGSGFQEEVHANTTYYINCIAQNCGTGSRGGDGFRTVSNCRIYNCTSVNSIAGTQKAGYGFWVEGYSTIYLTNCYAGGNDGGDFVKDGVTTWYLTTCHSNDATGNTQTVLSTSSGAYFINVTPGSEDLKFTSDSELIDVGTDLHADANYPFNWDAWETTRPDGSWDISAYEFAGGAPTVNHEAMMLGCNF